MQRVREQVQVPAWISEQEKNGVTVAVLDTGLGNHPDLTGRLLCFRDFVNDKTYPYDDSGHGTHVCGILCGSGMLSQGKYRGMAPASRLVVGKVLDMRGDGSCAHMLSALQWVLNLREKYGIRVVNISVGIGTMDCPVKEKLLQEQLERVWDSGIIVVCAAGNKGPGNGTISEMGNSRKVITVGCHDGQFCRNNPRRCETYSGRGEALASLRKPDLVAPGTDIISCNGWYRRGCGKNHSPYVKKSGTSMATPIVAGAAALVLQKFPELSNEEFSQKLSFTATDLGEPWNKQGWGMLNVRRLLE